jgi:hypothetical protein
MSALLQERRATHGEFTDHARIVQRLKALVEEEALRCGKVDPGTATTTFGPLSVEYADDAALDMVIAESLDMILHKIGRIVAGDAAFKDHWVDIAGYATLVADRVAPIPDRSTIHHQPEARA